MPKEIKAKILFLAPYPVGCAPSQRFKYEQYYPLFEKQGYSVTTSSFVNQAFWKIIYLRGFLLQKFWYTLLGYLKRINDLFSIRSYDLVYVHLWVTPLGPPIYERLVRLLAKKVIYDLDDMIYLGHSSEANKLFIGLKGKAKMPFLIKHADHVIVSSSDLFEYASEINANTTDISSTIDTDRFIKPEPRLKEGKLVIGWTGTHSTSKYLHLLDDVFKRLAEEMDFTLIVIGDENYHCDTINIDHRPWTVESEVSELLKIDIGLYPLPFEKWIMGKSGLKALTYMSLEIPCVASAIGANMRVIDNGITGFLVKSDDDWYRKIKELAEDKDKRLKMGKAGRTVVKDKFSIKSNIANYMNLFKSTLKEGNQD